MSSMRTHKRHEERKETVMKAVLTKGAHAELAHLHDVQVNIQQQLDVLRKTRGKRTVGEVKCPAHLQVGLSLDVSGVESRGTLLPIKGPRD